MSDVDAQNKPQDNPKADPEILKIVSQHMKAKAIIDHGIGAEFIPDDFYESEEFYELMQSYRHAPLVPQEPVVEAFEAVKAAARRYCHHQAEQVLTSHLSLHLDDSESNEYQRGFNDAVEQYEAWRSIELDRLKGDSNE
jgi:hypothetical protein